VRANAVEIGVADHGVSQARGELRGAGAFDVATHRDTANLHKVLKVEARAVTPQVVTPINDEQPASAPRVPESLEEALQPVAKALEAFEYDKPQWLWTG